MKKNKVIKILCIIAIIPIILLAAYVGILEFSKHENLQANKISSQPINTPSTAIKKAYNLHKFKPMLTQDTINNLIQSMVEVRLDELDSEYAYSYDCLIAESDKLHEYMYNYQYKSAYNSILSIFELMDKISSLESENNMLVEKYPELVAGEFEGGSWLFDPYTDLVDVDYISYAYMQLLLDTWLYKNIENVSHLTLDEYYDESQTKRGLIHVRNDNLGAYVGTITIEQEELTEGGKYTYFANYSDFVNNLNKHTTLEALSLSMLNTQPFDIIIEHNYEIGSVRNFL